MAPSDTEPWIRDTRFGAWLITSDVWVHYVVRVALAELVELLGDQPPPGATILDVGCGGGKALPVLEETFAPDTLLGIDPDPDMIERARAATARCRCRVDLRVGQAAALELPDDSLDMIFCHQTFHHLTTPERAVREFHRVLRPGGVLLFAESCAPFIRSLLIRLLFRHPMDVQRSGDDYLELLRSVGFVFTPANVSTPYPWWSRPDVGLLEWLGRPLPAHPRVTVLNVAARKPGLSAVRLGEGVGSSR